MTEPTTPTPDDASPRTDGQRAQMTLITCLLLMVAAWVEYLPSVRYGFVYYDDVRILLDHPELYGQSTLGADGQAIFKTSFPREEPLLLRDLSWAIDSRLFGFGNALGYHLGNVVLHGFVVALMYIFLLGTTRRRGFALAVTAAYLLLGIHTEPVVWIMGRKDILSTLFMLLALCAQTQRLTTTSNPARYGWYLLTLLAFAGGLLSKISVLSFPVVLLLHAIFLPYLRGERRVDEPFEWGRRLARELAFFLPAMALSGWIYIWYSRTLAQMGIFDRNYTAHGLEHLWNLLMVDPLALWVYLQQIFFPWHLRVLYPSPGLQLVYPAWQIVVSLATIAAIFGIGLWLFRRRKDLFFYLAAFFCLMVPYSNLQFVGIWVAERYVYFSSFCLLSLAVAVGADWLRRPQPVWRASILAAVLWMAGMNLFQTFAYQPAWRNAEALWEYHIAETEPCPAAYENLAGYYYAQITPQSSPAQMATILHKVSVVVDAGLNQFWPDRRQPPPPQTSFLFFLRSLVEEINGELDQALNSLLISDQLRPNFDSTNHNLAEVYYKLASASADPGQRKTYSIAARDRFTQYIKLAYRGRAAPPEIQNELMEYQALCDTNNQPAR